MMGNRQQPKVRFDVAMGHSEKAAMIWAPGSGFDDVAPTCLHLSAQSPSHCGEASASDGAGGEISMLGQLA